MDIRFAIVDDSDVLTGRSQEAARRDDYAGQEQFSDRGTDAQ